ncbi:GntR family transcriptional regulator [Vogesella sp. LIG4]|uniref:GntR family transcriptional regulator n=1 Tax=Vogesella sp. LIG4 TaxID=1192162 RepID=UPI00081F828D|nr:GntR family transcriptional regulator [Vogesella sp. LIG4]SCK06136.1 DNA-binding transcriptional regulator, GntR family [Vogesella sp. LIG4]
MSFKANDSLTEQIAQYLGHKIVSGDMQPGERIQELRITAELDVSRGSVREALLILQRRHLVDIYPRRGAIVSSISPDDVREVFELWFLLLEQAVVNLAASWQNDDLASFIELMTELGECQRRSDGEKFYTSGVAFLERLYQHCGNRYLKQTLFDLLPQSQRCLFAILRAGKSQIDRTHAFLDRLLKAIVARDEPQLRQLVREFGSQYSLTAQDAAARLQA